MGTITMGKRYLSVNYINDLSFKEPIMTKLNTISIVMLSALFLTPLVTNEMGELHFNRIIDTENLTEVSTDFTVVDTYTFTHEGRTYTNKIVAD